MQNYLLRRLILIIPTLIGVSILVFLFVRFIPGNVVDIMLGEQDALIPEPMLREQLIHKLGLDVPIYVQYSRWVGDIITKGSLGTSIWTNQSVIKTVLSRLPVSVELGLMALIIGQVIAIPLGVYSAIRQDTPGDYVARSISIIFLSVPNFWMATMVLVYSAVLLNWMPPVRYISFSADPLGNLGLMLMPALIMGFHATGSTMRLMRTTVLDVLRQDYIRTAWAKGLKEKTVALRHVMKNAFIPVITNIGLHVPEIIGGTVIMENIFNLPGMGRLLLESLTNRDYPMVSGINLFFTVFVIFTNIGVDISYAYFNPRIRYR